MDFFLKIFDFDDRDSIKTGLVDFINDKVVNKLKSFWTIKEEEEEVQNCYKAKYLITSSLGTIKYFDVLNCITSKEM